MKITRTTPVMPARCKTCPFNPDGDMELRIKILERTLLQSSQICHHPALHGRRQTHLCRGARDEQLTLLHRMGLIDAPTDQAFRAASDRILGAHNGDR